MGETIAVAQAIANLGTRPKIQFKEFEDAELLKELGKVAKEIIQLDTAFHHINSVEDPITTDRIAYRLTSAEQEFFLLFNNLRLKRGYEPLEGKRFTGDISYKSYLYDF
jgi:hypothetical protein